MWSNQEVIMGWAYSPEGRNTKCMWNFGGKILEMQPLENWGGERFTCGGNFQSPWSLRPLLESLYTGHCCSGSLKSLYLSQSQNFPNWGPHKIRWFFPESKVLNLPNQVWHWHNVHLDSRSRVSRLPYPSPMNGWALITCLGCPRFPLRAFLFLASMLCWSEYFFFLMVRLHTHIKRPLSVITHDPFIRTTERRWLLLFSSRGRNTLILWCRRKIFS